MEMEMEMERIVSHLLAPVTMTTRSLARSPKSLAICSAVEPAP